MINKIEREENPDEEYLQKLYQYKYTAFTNLMQEQFDLMQVAGFSYSDVEKLKVVEKRRFIEMAKKMLKDREEALSK